MGEVERERKSLDEKSMLVLGVVVRVRREEVVWRLWRWDFMESVRVGGAIGAGNECDTEWEVRGMQLSG